MHERFELNEEIFNLEVDSFNLWYNYSSMKVMDHAKNSVSIVGGEYLNFISLKGIKYVTSRPFETLENNPLEDFTFQISLPKEFTHLELINLELEENFLDYLTSKIINEPSRLIKNVKVCIYLHWELLPKSNLEFYIDLIKHHKVNDLWLAFRRLPDLISMTKNELVFEENPK